MSKLSCCRRSKLGFVIVNHYIEKEKIFFDQSLINVYLGSKCHAKKEGGIWYYKPVSKLNRNTTLVVEISKLNFGKP